MTAAAFHFFSFDPPSVMVGIRPHTFTFELISKHREFGINLPFEEQIDIVQICGLVSGREKAKFQKTGLTPVKGSEIGGMLVKECPVNLECWVVHEIQFEGSYRWFVGEVLAGHVADEYSRDDALMYWSCEYRSVGEVLLKVEGR